MARQEITRRVTRFTNAVEADARRRVAEDKGAAHMAQHSVRPSIDRLDFTSARKAEVEQMRREVIPYAAARTRLLTPALAHLWSEAIEMRLEVTHLPQLTFVDQRADR